jgi:hypothetical protein
MSVHIPWVILSDIETEEVMKETEEVSFSLKGFSSSTFSMSPEMRTCKIPEAYVRQVLKPKLESKGLPPENYGFSFVYPNPRFDSGPDCQPLDEVKSYPIDNLWLIVHESVLPC